jgi:hypothetical protein
VKQKDCSFWVCHKTHILILKAVHWLHAHIIRHMLVYVGVVWWPRFCLAMVRAKLVACGSCLCITGSVRMVTVAALKSCLSGVHGSKCFLV